MATAQQKEPKKRHGLTEFFISFRALLQEQKEDGTWKGSKGNVGYWMVLGTMLKIWNQTGQVLHLQESSDAAVQEVIVKAADVPEYLFLAFLALVTYGTIKKGKEIGGGISAGLDALKKMRGGPG